VPGRITQTMLNTQLMSNLQSNYNRMEEHNMKLSTGRRINRPSDDPVGISFTMRYRGQISENNQYQRNVDAATSWLDFTDTMLDQANSVISRIRELTVQGGSGTNSKESMKASAAEVRQLYKQLVNIGNTSFRSKYIFNGQHTNLRPYDETNADLNKTDNTLIHYEVSLGVTVPVNVSGNDVFGQPEADDNIYKVVNNVANFLEEGDTIKVGSMLQLIEKAVNRLQDVRSSVGARVNRIELTERRLRDVEINLTSLKSKTEDANMAEIITQMKMDENVYQASLSAGAKLIKPSLIDFLR